MFDTAMDALSGGVVPQQPSVPNSPDLDPSSPMNSQPNNAPAPQKQPSLWKSILTGALVGMAGSAGQTSFAGGLGAGAKASLQYGQQQKENELKAQETQSEIKFRDTQSALNAANAARIDQEIQKDGVELQQSRDTHAMKLVEFNRRFGVDYDVFPNTGDNATQYLKQAHANSPDGVSVPDVIVAPSHIYVQKQGVPAESKLDRYNKIAPLLGLPGADKGTFLTMKPEAQSRVLAPADSMLAGNAPDGKPYPKEQLRKAAASLEARLAAYKNKPEYDAAVAQQGQDTLDLLKKQIGVDQKADVKPARAPSKASAKDAAVMHFGSLPDGSQVAGTPEQLASWGAKGTTKMPADEVKKVLVARQAVAPDGLFASVQKDLATLQKSGKLGVLASRWSDFMAGKAGSDPEFAALRTHMGLLATALMQAHVGSRGSKEMLDHFKSLADYRISDGATLGSALNAEFSYVREKAMMPKGK